MMWFARVHLLGLFRVSVATAPSWRSRSVLETRTFPSAACQAYAHRWDPAEHAQWGFGTESGCNPA
jgi:hypothetical protein